MLRRVTLETLEGTGFSVDLGERDGWTAATGWTLDRYRVELPGEEPGPPAPGGPFERAADAIRDYRFADPRMVRATWDRRHGLEGRTMLLVVRYLGLRFRMGTRIYRVLDETRDVPGGRERRWGWGYATLTGHLEMGTMDVVALKDEARGTVAFEIDVRSRPAPIRNPVVRAGFRVVGRRAQRRFARRALARMDALVREGAARTA